LLIHDAQHTASELARVFRYGHSAADYGVELARRAGVAQVLLFHHDPDRTDEQVDAMVQDLRHPGGPHVDTAREGSVIVLGPAPALPGSGTTPRRA
jgi:ribonuclease BN (tRNA processing enzyme)